MNLSVNLGPWNSIFAIPCDIVDKHIKLAGSAQLKVLLFILRYAGKDISTEKIANALCMNELDVKDSMQYWIENNIISVPFFNYEKKSEITTKTFENNIIPPKDNEINLIHLKRIPTRVEKPDSSFVAKRIEESSEISYLMQEAQIILSRPISNGDSATLLMLHDTDGLPIDVILMIMQYAVSIGKRNMKYIEKMAISWAEEEIDSIEKAENKIRILENHKKAWNSIEKIIGIEHRSPSAKEDEAANRWINTWKISDDLIKEAYDRCINAKGKYILNYMDSIIKRWHNANIKNINEALAEDKHKKNQYAQNQNNDFTSYNIDEYESNYMYI